MSLCTPRARPRLITCHPPSTANHLPFLHSLAAVKAYDASSDEQLFLEVPLSWGSDAAATVAVTLKLPLLGAVRLPVTLRRLQLAAHVRVTARPLLEEYPYAGDGGGGGGS